MKIIRTVWKLIIMTLWPVSITTSSLGWQQWIQAVFRRLNMAKLSTESSKSAAVKLTVYGLNFKLNILQTIRCSISHAKVQQKHI